MQTLSFPDARLLIIGVAAGLATLGGGGVAILFRSQIGALSALGAGVVIAIAVLDLFPEAAGLGRGVYPPAALMLVTLAGFLLYWTAHRLKTRSEKAGLFKALGPASLVLHSLADGFGIGLAFAIAAPAGLTVAAAVLTHDLLDGSNTVALSMASSRKTSRAWIWLTLDAAAPLAGIGLSRLIQPPPNALALVLALFAGLFLYIGTCELLPRGRIDGTPQRCAVLIGVGVALVCALKLLGAS